MTMSLRFNITRRHLSKGQQAMITVKAAVTGNLSLREVASENKINRERVRIANVVLQYAPELVDKVIHGANRAEGKAGRAQDKLDQLMQNPSSIHLVAGNNVTSRPEGNTRAKGLRRLRKDRPDLVDRVKI